MIHYKLQVQGIVQGVGFRPYICRLAKHHHLTGWIYNDAQGVTIHIQGKKKDVTSFLDDLPKKAPVLSSIETYTIEEEPLKQWNDFSIRTSQSGVHQTLISPDMAPCDDCIKELKDPRNRRYRYPFINCTNCGPRYTIIQDIPYDRPYTTMSSFTMCSDCQKEYDDIQSRRYHAQPNACAICGPKLIYTGPQTGKDPFSNAIADLKEGKIVAIKGIGGIHLACDARNKKAIMRLRKRKQREAKPLAIMVKDETVAKEFVKIHPIEKEALISRQRPIVLCEKKDAHHFLELSENKELGILFPYSPLHILLMEEIDALVMTSANIRDTPVLINNKEAYQKLSSIADSFLLHDRKIENRCDDSLLRIVDQKPMFLRRSRGYAPAPLSLPEDVSHILALGAHQKGSFALGKGHHVFLSPYIGNMETIETMEHYQKTLHTYKRLFEIEPCIIACDMHPDYATTHLAKEMQLPTLYIQHHHAHMVACMGEHNLHETCFGIIWDGTGYGNDHTIWGGECMIATRKDFTRVGSIRPIPLLGNEQAIHEIGRIGLVLSWMADQNISLFDASKQNNLKQLFDQAPLSSGMGRLFDGFYSLITHTLYQDYDGQAPSLLESMAIPCTQSYPVRFYTQNGIRYYDWIPMIQHALQEECLPSIKAMKMMNTLINMATEQVMMLNPNHYPVILSGGCFQNKTLLQGMIQALRQKDYVVYWPHQVSCNDEGIALGQLLIAKERM